MRTMMALVVFGFLGCGGEPITEPPGTSAQTAAPLAISPPAPSIDPLGACQWPASDQVIVASCPGICKICVAYASYDVRSGTGTVDTAVDLNGCTLSPVIICVPDCSTPCG